MIAADPTAYSGYALSAIHPAIAVTRVRDSHHSTELTLGTTIRG
jgi:hypothetical protein